jgi:hypothetical protein
MPAKARRTSSPTACENWLLICGLLEEIDVGHDEPHWVLKARRLPVHSMRLLVEFATVEQPSQTLPIY